MIFADFHFNPIILDAVKDAGFIEPSPIQKDAIPLILKGKDIVAQAHTGTGKTAAFALPVLNMLKVSRDVEVLVIVPTRELSMQVSDEFYKFGKNLKIQTATIYGGTPYNKQIKHVKNSSVVVATPGRLIDLLSNKKISIAPKFVILDEADEMLDMGFLDDIKEIFTFIPKVRQTLMFSATMPNAIKKLATNILKDPVFVEVSKENITNENTRQCYYVVDEHERDEAIIRLFDSENPQKSIVFCRTKKEVDRLSNFMATQGITAKGLHGDMVQAQRENVIKSFKNDELEMLIATDVAARGLDVNDVSHVFNYHLPFDSDSYVHRIGRTGRAGKIGEAISIITPHEFSALKKIQKDIGREIETNLVPTIKDVRNKKIDSLSEKIKNKKVDPAVYDFIEQLKDYCDLSTITYKLASMIFEDSEVRGKDNIGKNRKQIKQLTKRHNRGSGLSNRGKKTKGGYRVKYRGKRKQTKNTKSK